MLRFKLSMVFIEVRFDGVRHTSLEVYLIEVARCAAFMGELRCRPEGLEGAAVSRFRKRPSGLDSMLPGPGVEGGSRAFAA